MSATLPERMQALVVRAADDPLAPPSARLTVAELPVARPGPGQVLIRMDAAPANPSDMMYIRGLYGVPLELDAPAGFEGTGTVVAAGGGMMGRYLKGKRVACGAQGGGQGTWSAYLMTTASNCLPLSRDIPPEQAGTLLVNPFTAFGLLDRAKQLGAGGVVQTAGASQVGKLVIRVAQRRGVPVVSLVRRAEQVDMLRAIDAEHVLSTADPSWQEELRALSKRLKATVAFDAVAGPMTAQLLQAMPKHSTAIVYGRLHDEPGDLYGGRYPVGEMIFADQKIEGFWLAWTLARGGLMKLIGRSREIQRLFADGALKTDIAGTHTIDAFPAALDAYERNMSAGKVILRF